MGLVRKIIKYAERFVLARQAYKFVLRQWTAPKDLTAAADVMATLRLRGLLDSVEIDAPVARRIVVIAPHPDDEMIGPGGTVIKAIRRGAEVTVLHLTREAGASGEVRAAEAREVAQRLGYAIRALDIPEGTLTLDSTTVERFARALDELRPGIVFVPFLLDDHPEHRIASQLLGRAWRDGRLGNAIEVWGYQVYSAFAPNVVVDITAVAGDKADAIRLWKNSTMLARDWAHFALGRDAFNVRFLDRGPEPHYAEAFIVLPIADYAEFAMRYADQTVDQSSSNAPL